MGSHKIKKKIIENRKNRTIEMASNVAPPGKYVKLQNHATAVDRINIYLHMDCWVSYMKIHQLGFVWTMIPIEENIRQLYRLLLHNHYSVKRILAWRYLDRSTYHLPNLVRLLLSHLVLLLLSSCLHSNSIHHIPYNQLN